MTDTILQTVWKNIYSVNAGDVDHRCEAKITSLCNYFQESAWQHATHLGLGYEALRKKNMAWVLSRLHLHILSNPHWRDEVLLETWPSGVDGPLALRDFYLRSANGDILVKGASAWLLLDLQSKRPARMEHELAPIIDMNQGRFAMDEKIPRLRSSTDGILVRTIVAGYTDLDANAHVNNVRYIAWACDAIRPEIHQNFRIQDFVINFLCETAMGEETAITCSNDQPLQFEVEGIHTGKQQASFRARIQLIQ